MSSGALSRTQAACSEPAMAPLGSALKGESAGKQWAAALWEQQPSPRLRILAKATWWEGKEPRDRNGDERPMKRNR